MPGELTGPIAVYGATGYTGRLAAAELVRRGVDAVLVGRSAAKLEIVAEDLGGETDTRVAELDDAAAARRAIELALGRLPAGPRDEDRRRARFEVVCVASADDRASRGTLRGTDVYGLTARATADGALRCAAPEFDRSGALAPSQAFDPRDFRSALGLGPELGPEPPG
jgi:short subunit dehydrogenase-like uncharacterized protein